MPQTAKKPKQQKTQRITTKDGPKGWWLGATATPKLLKRPQFYSSISYKYFQPTQDRYPKVEISIVFTRKV